MQGAATSSDAVDGRAMDIFQQAIREMGGPEELMRHGEQGILRPLMESAYILVLAEEAGKAPAQIAEIIGTSQAAVDSVFGATMEAAVPRIRYRASSDEEFDRHIDPDWSGQPMTPRLDSEYLVGALAKFAYDVVKRRHPRETPPPGAPV